MLLGSSGILGMERDLGRKAGKGGREEGKNRGKESRGGERGVWEDRVSKI